MSTYINRVIEDVKRKYSHQPEFIQTVEEVLKDYMEGKTDRIYELEEERIDFFCGNLQGDARYTPMHNGWSTHYTVNHI